jgi:hypothetical protein
MSQRETAQDQKKPTSGLREQTMSRSKQKAPQLSAGPNVYGWLPGEIRTPTSPLCIRPLRLEQTYQIVPRVQGSLVTFIDLTVVIDLAAAYGVEFIVGQSVAHRKSVVFHLVCHGSASSRLATKTIGERVALIGQLKMESA